METLGIYLLIGIAVLIVMAFGSPERAKESTLLAWIIIIAAWPIILIRMIYEIYLEYQKEKLKNITNQKRKNK